MSDLKKFQDELNSSEVLRARFLKDPAGVMRSRGFKVSREDERKMKRSFALLTTQRPDQQQTTKTEVSGSVGFKTIVGTDKDKDT